MQYNSRFFITKFPPIWFVPFMAPEKVQMEDDERFNFIVKCPILLNVCADIHHTHGSENTSPDFMHPT